MAVSTFAIQYCLLTVISSPSCSKSQSRRYLYCGRSSVGSVPMSVLTFDIMASCACCVRPSATFMCILAFRYSHCQCVIFSTLERNFLDHGDMDHFKPVLTSHLCCIRNRELQIFPSVKFVQPSLSQSCAILCRWGILRQMWLMDVLPRRFRYARRTSMRSMSPFDAHIQSMRSLTVSVNIADRPGSGHLAIWSLSSSRLPQHMHLFGVDLCILDSCLFVPQKPDTCLVTHTRYICGNAVITSWTASQLTKWKYLDGITFQQWKRSRATWAPQASYRAVLKDYVAFLPATNTWTNS